MNIYSKTQLVILNLLFQTNEDQPMLSEDAANLLNSTTRTIKNEMNTVKSILQENGADIISKRGYGYYLTIVNNDLFIPFQVSVSQLIFSYGYDFEEEDYYVRQLLVMLSCEKKYFTLDEISSIFYCSRTTASAYLKKAKEICEYFNLTIHRVSHYGLSLIGSELHLRYLLLELLSCTYRLPEKNKVSQAFTDLFYENDSEKLRRKMLDLLIKYKFPIKDYYINKLLNYIIMSKNRYTAKHEINISEVNQEFLKQSIAYSIASELIKVYPITINSEHELCGIALMILLCADYNPVSNKDFVLQYFYQQALSMTDMIHNYLQLNFGIAAFFSKSNIQIATILSHINLKIYFNMNHYRVITKKYSGNMMIKLPLPSLLTHSLRIYFVNNLNYTFDFYDFLNFCTYFDSLFSIIDLNYRKVKILMVGNCPNIILDNYTGSLLNEYKDKIDNLTYVNLYEIRYFDQSQYDAVLINNIQPYYYHYELPVFTYDFQFKRGDQSLRRAITKALLIGYDIKQIIKDLPKISLEYYPTMSNYETLLFQLAADMAKSQEYTNTLYQVLLENAANWPFNLNNSKIIVLPPSLCKYDFISVYALEKTLILNGSAIQYFFIFSIDFLTNESMLKIIYILLNEVCRDWKSFLNILKLPEEDYINKLTKLVENTL